jgi:hypothetical protein
LNQSPYELFTGRAIDLKRDFRADQGEPIIVKKPKGISSDLAVTGQWAVVVRRIMNGTGVLKVYLIQSKKYAYRLRFVRAVAPEWVLEALNNVDLNASIGFEEGAEADFQEAVDRIMKDKEGQAIDAVIGSAERLDDEDDVQIIGDRGKVDIIMQSVDSLEEVWHKTSVKAEIKDEVGEEERDEVEISAEIEDETNMGDPQEAGYM